MKIQEDVLAVLAASTFDGNAMALPPGELSRELYLRVAKVIEAAGGKWKRQRYAHIFPGDAADAIEPVILTGEVISAKQEFGAFFSPPAVVDRVMAIAGIMPDMLVLEPNAGEGALAIAASRAGARVTCVDILSKHTERLDELNRFDRVICGDFLRQELAPVYHRVVMNPSFAKQADIAHVMHAAKFLRPGGRLVSVMSASVQFRANRLTAEFRDFLLSRVSSIERLPEDSFKVSGTGVNACIVSLEAG